MTTLTQIAEARVELRTAINGKRRFEDEGSHPQGLTYDELDTWVRTALGKLEKLVSDYPGDWRYNTRDQEGA